MGREAPIKNLAYYISGHGYGHYARSIPVLQQLAAGFNVHIKSDVPKSLFTQYLDANHWLQPVDTGCKHTNNSLEVDPEATFKSFEIFQNSSMIEAEKTWLRENQIALVLSDVASMPVKAAHDIGVPSVLIRSEEHTSELQSQAYLVCRLLLEKKKQQQKKQKKYKI